MMAGDKVCDRKGTKHKLALLRPQADYQNFFYDDRPRSPALLTLWNYPSEGPKPLHLTLFWLLAELLMVAGDKVCGQKGTKHKLALLILQADTQKKFYDDRPRSLALLIFIYEITLQKGSKPFIWAFFWLLAQLLMVVGHKVCGRGLSKLQISIYRDISRYIVIYRDISWYIAIYHDISMTCRDTSR